MKPTLRTCLWTVTVAAALSGCATDDTVPGDDDDASCATGKCDSTDPSQRSPAEDAVRRLYADATRDGSITVAEIDTLTPFLKRYQGRNERIATFLQSVVAVDPHMTSPAKARLTTALTGQRASDVPLANDVYRVVPGANPTFLFDDALYLQGNGFKEVQTGIVSHSRGYAAKRDGVLFTRHGSQAPDYASTSSRQETDQLRQQGPDAALDKAATVSKLRFDQWNTFGGISHSPVFFDPSPNTPDWAGICQGWTYNALDNRLNALVDPPGAVGARGLWIFGQWVSRADLGNSMMAASYSFGIADATLIDSFVKPDSLVKALAEYVLLGGTGLRVDIWNDNHNASGVYNPQVWNQPIVAGRIEVAALTTTAQTAVLAFASADPQVGPSLPANAAAKLVRARASWGAETHDAWEAEPRYRTSEWNMYMITASDGRVLKAYMAYELASVAGLPTVVSDGLPDYMAIPKHELTEATMENGNHRLLDPSNPEGARFRFLVGTVLARGIPDPTRAAFETEVLGSATVDRAAIAARFPGIANAYSPQQWARVFAPRLGEGRAFGAVWPAP